MKGFNGTNCQNNINPCSSDPCQNNGICNLNSTSLQGYSCVCLPGKIKMKFKMVEKINKNIFLKSLYGNKLWEWYKTLNIYV